MSALRSLIDTAIAEVVAEHPKYFTPRGREHIRTTVTRKVMAAFREATKENESGVETDESATRVTHDDAMYAEPQSREGRAYANLCMAGHAVRPLEIRGKFRIPFCAAIRAVWTFADAPAWQDWPTAYNPRQIAAWLRFLSETLAGVARRSVVVSGTENEPRAIRVPWPWPPCKDGSLSHHQEPEELDERIDG